MGTKTGRATKQRSLFSRLFFTLQLPLMLLLVGLMAILTLTTASDARERERETLNAYIDNVSGAVQTTFVHATDSLVLTAQVLSGLDKKSADAAENVRNTLKMFITASDRLYCAWVVFEPGVMGTAERYTLDLVREGDGLKEIYDLTEGLLDDPVAAPWYNEPRDSGEVFFDSMDYYDYGDGPVYTATISCPIIVDGKVVGVLGMDMRYEDMFTFLYEYTQLSTRELALLTDGGEIAYIAGQSEAQYALDTLLPDGGSARVRDAIARHSEFEGELDYSHFSETAFVRVQPLKQQNASDQLYLMMAVPKSVLNGRLSTLIHIFGVAGSVAILLMTLVLYTVSRRLVRPITLLTNSANEMANGNLDVEFDVRGVSVEVTQLNASLRKLIHQMKEDIHAREEFSANLEQKISERTYQLKLMTDEAEQARLEALKAADNKTLFFANMSHEIRTPMNAITGMSDLLLTDELTDDQRRYVNYINSSAKSLLTIINDILDVSAMEYGRMVLQCKDYNLMQMVENIGSMIGFLARQKQLNFIVETGVDLPRCQYGDETRLKQVLVNLLNNAVKYTGEGTVTLSVRADAGHLVFDVTDTGYGISAEDIPKLFDAFEQFHLDKKRQQGTGLGLPICKNLVDLMNGSISVVSARGAGSTFTVTVPRVDGNPDNVNELQLNSLFQAPDAKVLVVDDNEVNLVVAEGHLNLFGIQPDLARSGEQAIECVRRKEYDMVFMDHMMPGMDGIEATDVIRAMGERFEQLVIVALTANVVDGARQSCLEGGMNDFISKPVDILELGVMLRRWLPETRLQPASEEQHPAVTASAPAVVYDAALEVERALAAMGGRLDSYHEVVRAFVASTPPALDAAAEALASDRLPVFKTHIHGLKSALALVGAFALSERAKRMELEALDGNLPFCQAQFVPFRDEVGALTHRLAQQLDSQPVLARPDGDKAALAQQLPVLQAQLRSLQADDAAQLLNRLMQSSYTPDADKLLAAADAHLANFAYEAAIDALKALRKLLD